MWQDSGYRVLGCALAARAARELEDGAGIESDTLTRLLGDIDRYGGLDPRTVVVVDEAAMVGTRQLSQLLDLAAVANSKVVLVGDDAQLQSIEAGGLFYGLRTRLGAVELTENRRQREDHEKAQVALFRDGRAQEALAHCERNGNLYVGQDADEARTAMLARWLK